MGQGVGQRIFWQRRTLSVSGTRATILDAKKEPERDLAPALAGGASDVTRTRDRLLLVGIYYTMVIPVSGCAATNNPLRISQSFGILILIDTILYQR